MIGNLNMLSKLLHKQSKLSANCYTISSLRFSTNEKKKKKLRNITSNHDIQDDSDVLELGKEVKQQHNIHDNDYAHGHHFNYDLTNHNRIHPEIDCFSTSSSITEDNSINPTTSTNIINNNSDNSNNRNKSNKSANSQTRDSQDNIDDIDDNDIDEDVYINDSMDHHIRICEEYAHTTYSATYEDEACVAQQCFDVKFNDENIHDFVVKTDNITACEVTSNDRSKWIHPYYKAVRQIEVKEVNDELDYHDDDQVSPSQPQPQQEQHQQHHQQQQQQEEEQKESVQDRPIDDLASNHKRGATTTTTTTTSSSSSEEMCRKD